MARLDLPDKFRDEDSTERRWWTRRRKKRGGRRSVDPPSWSQEACPHCKGYDDPTCTCSDEVKERRHQRSKPFAKIKASGGSFRGVKKED